MDNIENILKNFLWEVTQLVKKWHLLSWSEAAKPKCAGGLRLRRLEVINRALTAKQTPEPKYLPNLDLLKDS